MLPAFRADEQPEGPGRGGDSDGADLRLTDASPIRGEQFSFSPAEAKQIACFLADNSTLPDAVRKAKEVINIGIENARNMRLGDGNGPLWIPCKIKK